MNDIEIGFIFSFFISLWRVPPSLLAIKLSLLALVIYNPTQSSRILAVLVSFRFINALSAIFYLSYLLLFPSIRSNINYLSRETVFDHIFKHREETRKGDAQRNIFDKIRDSMNSFFEKGCPTKAHNRARQCRKVLWVVIAHRCLIEVLGVQRVGSRNHEFLWIQYS